MVTKCLYDKKQYAAYTILKEYRQRLLENKKIIKVTDFGAGSRVFSSDERKISAIAGNAGIPLKRAKLLNRLIAYLEIENVLELGTSLGISTAAMAAKNNVKIITLEGCPETAKIARQQFEVFNLKKIDSRIGEFDVLLEEVLEERKQRRENREENRELQAINSKQQIASPKKVRTEEFQIQNHKLTSPELTNPKSQINQSRNLVFFDGNHQKEATLTYFEKLLPLSNDNSVFIFDDIHWSKEMEEAWEEIKQHPAVCQSIDTFFWGMVFFRKKQEKQHFVVRV